MRTSWVHLAYAKVPESGQQVGRGKKRRQAIPLLRHGIEPHDATHMYHEYALLGHARTCRSEDQRACRQ